MSEESKQAPRGRVSGLGVIGLAIISTVVLVGCAAGLTARHTRDTKAPPQNGTAPVRTIVGVGSTVEQEILGQLYYQTLKGNAFPVELDVGLGSPATIDGLLTSGKIQFALEDYEQIFAMTPNLPSDYTSATVAATAFENGRGLALAGEASFSDGDAIAVRASFAQRHGLASIADLRALGKGVTLAAKPGFATAYAGLVGLRREYGVVPTLATITTGAPLVALERGRANSAVVSSTDPALADAGFVLLSDPQLVFGVDNVVGLVSGAVSREGGYATFSKTLTQLGIALNTRAMQKLNAEVTLHHQTPACVAAAFLVAQKLPHYQRACTSSPAHPRV